MFSCEVEKIDIPLTSSTDDSEFWKSSDDYRESRFEKYARLRLKNQADREELSLNRLKQHGLKAVPQSAIRISDELAMYLDEFIT